MGYDHIPRDILVLHQWCNWRAITNPQTSKPDKIPFSPLTGQRIDYTNPANWCNSDVCIKAALTGNYSGIGFCLATKEQGGKFTFIDCDVPKNDDESNRQKLWHEQLDSYSEYSPSGLGVHIIVEGYVPAGRKIGGIEVYSDRRFMTVTGNVFNTKPIANRSKVLLNLYNDLPGSTSNERLYIDQPQIKEDEQVKYEATNTKGLIGPLFTGLWEGRWQELNYPSQSEADFALIDMIAFFSKNNEQILRLFLQSGLGQRTKAQTRINDYVGKMVNRAHDLDDLCSRIKVEWSSNVITPIDAPKIGVERPAGLMGNIADFILSQATLPVQEIAVCAALSLMAGICGRQYKTPTNAGLNLYTVLVGKTGTGKEAMSTGLHRIKNVMRTRLPAFEEFYGPSMISSGPALHKALTRKRSCLSISNEFGHQIEAMCAEHPPAHLISLRSMLLTIYSKSDRGHSLGAADYADAADNIPSIVEPAFSINSDTTRSLYEDLNEKQIALGLIPRLLIIEYHGGMVDENLNVNIDPPQNLINQLGALSTFVITQAANNEFISVKWTQESYELDRAFFNHAQSKVNNTNSEAVSGLWSRARLSIMKIASLLAIGEHYIYPTISVENWNWAKDLVVGCVENLVLLIETNRLGRQSDENKQVDLLKKLIQEYIEKYLKSKKPSTTYRITQTMVDDNIISLKYFSDRLTNNKAFHPDRGRKGPEAVLAVIKHACEMGWIRPLTSLEAITRHNTSSKMWQILKEPD